MEGPSLKGVALTLGWWGGPSLKGMALTLGWWGGPSLKGVALTLGWQGRLPFLDFGVGMGGKRVRAGGDATPSQTSSS